MTISRVKSNELTYHTDGEYWTNYELQELVKEWERDQVPVHATIQFLGKTNAIVIQWESVE